MSDAEYLIEGPLIDLVTLDWREDILPFEHILVKPNSLPDPDPQPENQGLLRASTTEQSGELRWNELDLDGLLAHL